MKFDLPAPTYMLVQTVERGNCAINEPLTVVNGVCYDDPNFFVVRLGTWTAEHNAHFEWKEIRGRHVVHAPPPALEMSPRGILRDAEHSFRIAPGGKPNRIMCVEMLWASYPVLHYRFQGTSWARQPTRRALRFQP